MNFQKSSPTMVELEGMILPNNYKLYHHNVADKIPGI